MEQFLFVAAAHFLALLSPGPDFFLVARTSVKSGWHHAAKVCLGIAMANGLFIFAAFSGITLFRAGSISFTVIQLAGCLYLLYVGQLFIRFAGRGTITENQVSENSCPAEPSAISHSYRGFSMGFLSGILNPKNALFYASLATLINGPQVVASVKVLYGAWMFSIVLLWDLLIAMFVGNQRVLRHFSHILPWVERISGVILIGLALSVISMNVIALS
ncbi:LysE family translocator [Nissabacter sp. SGAir0207]|uniref:LysE family translocator n=1 Tax=Nissabacter sp. SGAir0207 TaxID=2126321 RepID=UPI0010CD33D0|nr:LysE family translocator [Nissabacter sp. SGAir0207]QCR38677.1 lysine transporter LysE [Nissabacter sp. SGAir0207]